MGKAENYADWRNQALSQDERTRVSQWITSDKSRTYDYKVIRRRFDELRSIRESGDPDRLLYYISEGLHGNMGSMGAPGLYARTKVGTKKLVSDYIDELVSALDEAAQLPGSVISKKEKRLMFRRASASYGRTALMLGDAGSLGPFHVGVTKALWKEGLLPRIISGASSGSIMAAIIGTRQDAELESVFASKKLVLSTENQTRDIDVYDLHMLVKTFVPDLTFAEAYEQTGVHLNISVGPAEMQQRSRLLSATTSPNALIREAVYASCAIPGVLPPVTLMAKDRKGNKLPYIQSRKWVDGSITDDQPSKRLARLYGVNYFISSQANPWRNPNSQVLNTDLFARWNRIWQSAGREWLRAIYPIAQEGIKDQYPQNVMMRMLFGVLTQEYNADINITPETANFRTGNFLQALSPEETSALIKDGEKATWPHVERIRITTAVARRLDDIMLSLGEEIA